MIAQATNLVSGAPFSGDETGSPLWTDALGKIAALQDAGKVDTATAESLRSATRQALLEEFRPAYDALLEWLREDSSHADSNARGVGELPDGKAFYAYSLKTRTTTDLTADEIHEIGLREVARLRGEMEALKDRMNFDGDLQAFFAYRRDDDRSYYPNTDAGRQAYLDDSTAYLEFIGEQLPKYFGLLPKAALVVRRVESFREQDGAPQHYKRGTPDGSRPGVYYAHLSDMRAMPKTQMEAVAYHEGNPGHHMQVSIAQELSDLPTFRTQTFFTAHSEGWALYAELLAKEMGAYQNDSSKFGRLVTEMWRAIRLVVDTGIHAKGWTKQRAITYFQNNSSIAEPAIEAEVERYFVLPGQATAYKIGMLKIQELRQHALDSLGDAFDIRAFHDAILGGGGLPLTILERRVQHWINASQLQQRAS